MKFPIMVAAAIGLGSVAFEHPSIFSGAFVRTPEVQSVPPAPAPARDPSEDEDIEDERRKLASQLEAERADAEKRERDHELELQALRLNQTLRLRELEYRKRLAQDEASEARRAHEAEAKAHREALAEERQESEQALRRAWSEKPARTVTETVVVERRVPVFVPRAVQPHHGPVRQSQAAGGVNPNEKQKKRQTP